MNTTPIYVTLVAIIIALVYFILLLSDKQVGLPKFDNPLPLPPAKKTPQYEYMVRQCHENWINKNLSDLAKEGWEVYGFPSTYHCHQGNQWLIVPLRRKIVEKAKTDGINIKSTAFPSDRTETPA